MKFQTMQIKTESVRGHRKMSKVFVKQTKHRLSGKGKGSVGNNVDSQTLSTFLTNFYHFHGTFWLT